MGGAVGKGYPSENDGWRKHDVLRAEGKVVGGASFEISKAQPHCLSGSNCQTGTPRRRKRNARGGPNVAIIGEPREINRVALKILLLVMNASVLSFKSTAAILPQSPDNSGTIDVRFPVPVYYQQYAAQDGNPAPTTGRLLLLLPPNFDSRRAWPILIVTPPRMQDTQVLRMRRGTAPRPQRKAGSCSPRMQRSAPEMTQSAGGSRFWRRGWTWCIVIGQNRRNGRWCLLASRAARNARNGLERPWPKRST